MSEYGDSRSRGGGQSGGYGTYEKKAYSGNSNSGGQYGGGQKAPEFTGMYKSYAVQFDKDTPAEDLDRIKNIARELNDMGWTMRISATNTVLISLDVKKEVILPFSSFDYEGKDQDKTAWYPSKHCKLLAKLLSRGWDNIPEKAQSFVVHNWSMMVGRNLNSYPEFFLTWTPDGIVHGSNITRDTGYTQTHIDIATKYNVPIFNFKNDGDDKRVLELASVYFNKQDKPVE